MARAVKIKFVKKHLFNIFVLKFFSVQVSSNYVLFSFISNTKMFRFVPRELARKKRLFNVCERLDKLGLFE